MGEGDGNLRSFTKISTVFFRYLNFIIYDTKDIQYQKLSLFEYNNKKKLAYLSLKYNNNNLQQIIFVHYIHIQYYITSINNKQIKFKKYILSFSNTAQSQMKQKSNLSYNNNLAHTSSIKSQSSIQNSQQSLPINIANSYKTLKASFSMPLKIKMFFSMLENANQKYGSPAVSKDLQKNYKLLISVFKRKSQSQQEIFLYQSLKIVKSIICSREKDGKESKQKDKDDSNSSQSDGMDIIKDIQTTCKIRQSFLGFDKWQKKTFKLNTKNCKLKLSDSKKQTIFNLSSYFIRKSQKYSKTITLQSISDSIQLSKSEVYIYFDNLLLFQEIYNHIFSCVVEVFAREVIKLANQKQKQKDKDKDRQDLQGQSGNISSNINHNFNYKQDLSTNTNDEITKGSTILTSKVLNQYFQIKDKIIRKLQNCSYKFQPLQTNIPFTKIGLSKHKNKVRIKIQKAYQLKISELSKMLSLLSREKDSRLIEYQVLEEFSTNINVVYFKYFFNAEVYEFLTILQENSRNVNDQKILIFKGIDNFINKQFVDFMYIRFKDNGNGQTMMRLMGIVKNQQKNKNQAVEFLLSLVQPVIREKQKQKVSVNEEEFWTVKQMENVEMQEIDEFYGNSLNNQALTKRNQKFEQQIKIINVNLLKRKYTIEPTAQKSNKFLTQHPLFKEWVLHKSGGVLCTNQDQINEQKKVFKWVLSQIGSNIVKRKNILNVSFPITIFSKQSHLKSVARNFSFAPMLLQKVVQSSTAQKMKAAIMFQISTAILIISMNKPFNPILGETYQGYIDDCPIFIEQTSHHPPISSYLLIGRGYKIHGAIAPKVALGLNCVKGWSTPLNFIEFQDGTKFQFTMNKMVINGMLFGQRTFNFEGTNYIVDYKNKLAAEISYGSQGNSVFKKKQLTLDSVSGAIYDLSGHIQKINPNNFRKNQKQRISIFNGFWHQQIKIDGKKAINFKTDLPYALIDHEYPIPSDSSYRTDLQQLIKGNQQNAQIQKDFLQEVQRRDRKLRQQHQKNFNNKNNS